LAFLFESLREGIQVYVILDVERNVARVPVPHPRRELGKDIGCMRIESGVPEMDQLHRDVAKGDKDHVQHLLLPRAELGRAEGAGTHVPFPRVQFLLLEERVVQHVAVKPSPLDGRLAPQHVDIELQGFGPIVHGDAHVLHTLQVAPQSCRALRL
jgi:hypothetical protein